MADDPAFSEFKVDRSSLPGGVKVYGNGFVGGKAKGLIFAMKAYDELGGSMPFSDKVRFPRSYILSSDFFDSFMEENYLKDSVNDKCMQILTVKEMNQKILEAEMPSALEDVLYDILQNEVGPLIIRSSSLMEDSIDYSFAGIYESIFIPNTGTLEYRIKMVEKTIKRVYASTFNNNAKEYRKRHRIPWQKEKMSIIIQNVIGREHEDNLFYPLVAGVAFSRNYYPWTKRVLVDDGVCRLVVGLGTRAVGRDYARVFSLSNPGLRPEGVLVNEILRYSQTSADVMDLSTGDLSSVYIDDLKGASRSFYLTSSVLEENQYLKPANRRISPSDRVVPTFARLLAPSSDFPFVDVLREVLVELERYFGVPIDIEFAMDFDEEGQGTFYLVQARPLGSRPEHQSVTVPEIERSDLLIRSCSVMGNGVRKKIRHILYVPPENFNMDNVFGVARDIGNANTILDREPYILIGPGRWGTSSPETGIPVSYSDISNASIIVELSFCNTAPELSYGTHFFGDLTASNILYMPVYIEKGRYVNIDYLGSQENKLNSQLVYLITRDEGFDVYADAEEGVGIVCLSQEKEE